MTNLRWPPIIDRAATIAAEYDILPTLRQLFYRLVAAELIPNNRSAYNVLSRLTADLRRRDAFPELYEYGRDVHQAASWIDPADALRDAVDSYRLDRTEGQDYTVVLGVEKNALLGLLMDWFGWPLGLPVIGLVGQSSETLERKTRRAVNSADRPAVLIYAGDFDPSGEAISRNFMKHTADCWYRTVRIALNEDQVTRWNLPVALAKSGDPNARRFIHDHPEMGLAQVELDALEPSRLRELYRAELDHWWDEDAYQDALAREADDREQLREVADAA